MPHIFFPSFLSKHNATDCINICKHSQWDYQSKLFLWRFMSYGIFHFPHLQNHSSFFKCLNSTIPVICSAISGELYNSEIPGRGLRSLSYLLHLSQIQVSRSRDSCRQLFKRLEILPLQSEYIFSVLLLFVVKNKDLYTTNHKIITLPQDRIQIYILQCVAWLYSRRELITLV